MQDELDIPPVTPAATVDVVRWNDGRATRDTDDVAAEEPLAIRVRGRVVSITMRTPGFDDELAVGFLLTEGVIRSAADVLRVSACERNEAGNVIDVLLAAEVHVDFDRLTRHVFASSSCGLCGRTTIDTTCANQPRLTSDVTFDVATLARLPDTMRAAQQTFERTGGLHAAALFDERGELVALREDVGRHNAVDKVIGHCLLGGIAPTRHLLLVSGRTSFEILQKAAAARVPVVAAVSAPSSLAVTFAIASGQTLIGFLRGSRMNVYAHPHRVVLPRSS